MNSKRITVSSSLNSTNSFNDKRKRSMSTFTRSLWGSPCHSLNKDHGAATFFKGFISGFIYASTFLTVPRLRIKIQNRQSNLDKTACSALVIYGIYLRSSVGSGKLTKVDLQFFTRALNCFNELHYLFYLAGKIGGGNSP